MKNRMIKLMGIVLTLAILSGLLISAVPVSAGNLTWDNVSMPSGTSTDLQLVQSSSASLFEFAPDGKTVFAVNKSFTGGTVTSTNPSMFKSADAGITWTTTSIGANLPAGVIALAVSPNYATDTTVLAATTTQLWRSRNGGQTFLAVTGWETLGVGDINSVDIAPYYVSTGGTAMLIGGSTGIALYSDDTNWVSLTANATYNVGYAAGTTVIMAKFSPNYQNDGEVLAVVSGVTGLGMTAAGTVLETKFATSNWNATVRPAALLNPSSVQITNATTATMAFPSDYNSSSSTLNRVYVAVGNPGVSTGFEIWRVNGSVNSTGTVVNGTGLKVLDAISSANTVSLAYTGTVASGTLVAGQYGTAGIWYATTPNGTPTWVEATNPPTGRNTFVAFPTGSTTLYAGTDNDVPVGYGAGFFTSTDYNTYQAISLISVPDLTKISLNYYQIGIAGSKDQFIMLNWDAAGAGSSTITANDVNMVFKSTDAGATWAEVFSLVDPAGQQLNNINPTGTYATDKTVYVPQNDKTIWKSTDGGASWNSITATTPDNTISAFSVIDANTYWLGSGGGGLYKSGSYTKTADLDGQKPTSINTFPFGMVIVANSAPTPSSSATVYLSTDNAATFTRLGNIGQFPNGATTAFDVGAKTIYAVNTGTADLKKWIVGTSTAWEDVVTVAYTTPTITTPVTANVTGLARAGDGTLYVKTPNVTGTNPLLLRSVNLTAPAGKQQFFGVPNTSDADFGITGNLPGGRSTIVVNDATANTNTIYQIVGGLTSVTDNGYPFAIKSFIDTLTGKVTVTAPKDKDQVATAYTFKWNAIPSPQQITYTWQVSTDTTFDGIQQEGNTTATTAYVQNLVAGTQYYFRVSAVTPLPSKWSDTVSFIVKLGVSNNQDLTGALGNRISPPAGATGVPLSPSFQWAAVQGSDSYHIQVADNPGFTSPIADATTKDTFFTVATPLKPGTTYYWRIQAVSGTNASDYVSNVFTTAAPVVAPPASTGTGAPPVQTAQPTIIVTVPAQTPAPVSTPAYIWVIIVIGAILVIAVIVLIARTRRV